MTRSAMLDVGRFPFWSEPFSLHMTIFSMLIWGGVGREGLGFLVLIFLIGTSDRLYRGLPFLSHLSFIISYFQLWAYGVRASVCGIWRDTIQSMPMRYYMISKYLLERSLPTHPQWGLPPLSYCLDLSRKKSFHYPLFPNHRDFPSDIVGPVWQVFKVKHFLTILSWTNLGSLGVFPWRALLESREWVQKAEPC